MTIDVKRLPRDGYNGLVSIIVFLRQVIGSKITDKSFSDGVRLVHD